jgi:predicted GTPase
MPYGAGFVAATRARASIIDPRPIAAPEFAAVFTQYPHIGPVLPALGYTGGQLAALRQTIEAAPVDAVVSATPIDLAALVRTNQRIVRVRYEFTDVDEPGLTGVVEAFFDRSGLASHGE